MSNHSDSIDQAYKYLLKDLEYMLLQEETSRVRELGMELLDWFRDVSDHNQMPLHIYRVLKALINYKVDDYYPYRDVIIALLSITDFDDDKMVVNNLLRLYHKYNFTVRIDDLIRYIRDEEVLFHYDYVSTILSMIEHPDLPDDVVIDLHYIINYLLKVIGSGENNIEGKMLGIDVRDGQGRVYD